MNHLLIVTLAGYRQHALDVRTVRGFFVGYEAEERTDCRQTEVPRAYTGRTICLEILKECTDQCCIDIFQVER